MGLFYTTLIGYMVLLAVFSVTLMYYLVKAFDSTQSTKIDPKPAPFN